MGHIRAFLYAPPTPTPPTPPPHPVDMKDVIWQPFCFQNRAKITLRQAFLGIYILCKPDTATCDILNFRLYQ